MNTHVDQTVDSKHAAKVNDSSQQNSKIEFSPSFTDSRPQVIAQRKTQELADNSPKIKYLTAIQQMADHSTKTATVRQRQAGNVAQLKGNLSRTQVQEVDHAGTDEVAIGAWKPTRGGVLSSSGYGGCMAIVVNDPAENVGALAHVYDAAIRHKESETQGKGTSAVNEIVEQMIASTGKPVNQLECMIWAGVGINGTIDGGDYSAGVASMKWRRFIDNSQRVIQVQGYGSSILYDSTSAKCYTGSPKIEVVSGGGMAAWGLGPLQIPDYGASESEEEEQEEIGGGLFAGLQIHDQSSEAVEVQPARQREDLDPRESNHRGELAETLFGKAETYFDRSNDNEKFTEFCELLEDWSKGYDVDKTIFPRMMQIMSQWKAEIEAME